MTTAPRVCSETDLAYLAGLIDGEGCIMAKLYIGKTSTTLWMQMHISNTNPELINWLAERFGGTTTTVRRSRPHHKDALKWCPGRAESARLLTLVLPYLVIKRRQAELFIELRATADVTGRHMQPEVKVRRLAMAAEITSLNRRGAA